MTSTFRSCCSFSSDLHSSEQGGIIWCVWSFCRWWSKWWLVFVGLWCYSGLWVWILKALAQFNGRGSPGLFQDFECGYIKNIRHHTVHICWTRCSGYDCRFSFRGMSVPNLWIANFRFSFYEVCVQNHWVHKTLRS